MIGKLTGFARVLIGVAFVGLCYGGLKFAEKQGLVPKADIVAAARDDDTIRVGVVTWGGYAGGQSYNKGFKANTQSGFYKDCGIKVEFVLNDDFVSSREAWKAGEIDLQWTTADSFSTESEALKEHNPKIIFQADYSRGGDAIVVRRGINSVLDLKGKKVAVAEGTPSHSFLLLMLEAGDLNYEDLEVIKTDSAIAAAAMFKSGNVDAAVVWSPDDKDCVKNVEGSKILKSTKEATHAIADVFYVKESYLDSHKKQLTCLVKGWLKGNAAINSSEEAKNAAVQVLVEGLNLTPDLAENAINNARFDTYGDNLQFFSLDEHYEGITGEKLYTKMASKFAAVGASPSKVPAWRNITNLSILQNLGLTTTGNNAAESAPQFTKPSEAVKTAPAFSTKRVSISFPVGSAVLDDNNKYVIENKFGDIAKSFGKSRIRIEGNTDNTGSDEGNRALSQRRAKAVADFLQKTYNFDPNRFVIVGNGSTKPVENNDTEEGRAKNRRTDFELIGE